MQILVLNAGSSSLKFETISSDGWRRHVKGSIEHFGESARIGISLENAAPSEKNAVISGVKSAVEFVLSEVVEHARIDAVGHRVVHGGEQFKESVLIDESVMQGIRGAAELAPLHNASSIQGIEAAQSALGGRIPHVAVFDTAFHQTLPQHAFLYAIPYELYKTRGIRRYGFHGTSYRYIWSRYLAVTGKKAAGAKIIALHLGNGCSICAIADGRSLDTSMGLTPLEGLVMGTRSGDIDASVMDFLARREAQTTAEIEDLLNRKSGLLGVSGLNSDMRELIKAADQHHERAELAINLFCYRARKYIGAYLAAMNGADALVFTGGIGEHNGIVRSRICQGLEWLGIKIDGNLNSGSSVAERLVSSDDSRVAVYVVPTDEELVIAQDTARLAAPLQS